VFCRANGSTFTAQIILRTALDGFVLGDVEKDYLLPLIQWLSAVSFTEVLGFCLIGNHFHLLVRMHPGTAFSDADIRTRFQRSYGVDSNRQFTDGQIRSEVGQSVRIRQRNCSPYSEGE